MKNRLMVFVGMLIIMVLSTSSVLGFWTATIRPESDPEVPNVGKWRDPNANCNVLGRYQCVNESIVNITSELVDNGTSSQFFGFSDFTLPAHRSISSITLHYYTFKSPSAGCFYPLVRMNNQIYESALICPDSFWGYKSKTWTTNPNTNQPWTQSDLNNFQGGMRADGIYPFGKHIYVAQVYATVDYVLDW